ncbi:MAG: 2-oxoisovalerate dehydrogenase subunit beta [Candidatus Anoxychlamydiales bacterium]|nr:2-oxoisovalerate dehydrogenase subunit beta [Candidatus Anoxychlamydiales bacterium]
MSNIDLKSKDRCQKTLSYLYIARFTDEKMNKLVKQNKGTTFFLSHMGHELIGILAAFHLTAKKDWALPYYRDRAFVIGLGADLKDLFASFLARDSNHHSSGRMMPDHFCDKTLNITCQSSCVGSQFLQAVGVAKALQKDEIVYVSAGDGATSQGDFHEALNFSSIYKLPVLFSIQDNEYAISVTKKEQTAGLIEDVFQGYENLKIITVDGTDYLKTSKALIEATKYLKEKNGPVLLVSKVPRLGAHSISDDPKKYKSQEIIEKELKKDPVVLFEKFLLDEKILDKNEIEDIKKQAFDFVEKKALDAEDVPFASKDTVSDKLFSPIEIKEKVSFIEDEEPITIMDAINHALIEEMQKDPNIIVFGQDVAGKKGGVFGITKNLTDKFSKTRCFNTPLGESTIIGLATGMSMAGKKPVCEIQFSDYIWTGINQLVNEIASIYYRSNGEYSCPAVIRIPTGGYIQGGPYHSQSIEAFLAHVPGLKIVAPSNAKDAKMLLKAAIKDPNPVVFLEHKAIYRQRNFAATLEPTEDSIIPFGKAKIVHPGDDITIVCYSMMVMYAVEIAKKLKKEGISVEVIDLRTIVPLDLNTILNSVKKTSKLLILHEDKKFAGFGAEILSLIQENAFDYLDAPIKRIGALDIPVPYSKILEDAYFPQKDMIEKEIKKLYQF